MNKQIKRSKIIMPVLIILTAVVLLNSKKVSAHPYFYFEKPESNADYKIGDTVPVEFFVGVVEKTTRFDAWGNPTVVTYGTMPAQLKVLKAGKEIYSQDFEYTKPTTLKTSFVPDTDGTLKLEIYGKTGGLGSTAMGLYDSTTINVKKIKANTLKVKGLTAKVKYSKLRKKTQYLKVDKVLKISNKGQGNIKYTKVSGNKKITINKKSGKVAVKKGLKKGTYKVKIKVRASGNDNYKAVTKTAVFKIKVK